MTFVATPPPRSPVSRTIDLLLDYGIYVALVVLVVALSIASPYFLTINNLLNVGQAIAIVGIIAAAMTVAMIAGQLDLTVGSIVGLTAVISAHLIVNEGASIAVAATVSIVASLGVGVLTGILVVNVGINSIIATLALGLAVRGLAFVLASGQQITIADPAFSDLVFSRPLGIPVPVLVMAVIYTAAATLMYTTRVGWHLYAVGGNESAARRAGIHADRLKRLVFLITAGCAAIAGLILTARASSAVGNYGTGLEFNVLTAVLLGGIGLSGGAGRIERTLAGVILVGILTNGLTLINMPYFYQQIVYGLVFVAAVVLDAVRRRRQAR